MICIKLGFVFVLNSDLYDLYLYWTRRNTSWTDSGWFSDLYVLSTGQEVTLGVTSVCNQQWTNITVVLTFNNSWVNAWAGFRAERYIWIYSNPVWIHIPPYVHPNTQLVLPEVLTGVFKNAMCLSPTDWEILATVDNCNCSWIEFGHFAQMHLECGGWLQTMSR